MSPSKVNVTGNAAGIRPKNSIRKVVFASLIGTAIEWYDFFLYGSAAALVFGPLFFPSDEPATGVLLAFGTYAVGFVGRPVLHLAQAIRGADGDPCAVAFVAVELGCLADEVDDQLHVR